jgi:hypothetical protein
MVTQFGMVTFRFSLGELCRPSSPQDITNRVVKAKQKHLVAAQHLPHTKSAMSTTMNVSRRCLRALPQPRTEPGRQPSHPAASAPQTHNHSSHYTWTSSRHHGNPQDRLVRAYDPSDEMSHHIISAELSPPHPKDVPKPSQTRAKTTMATT